MMLSRIGSLLACLYLEAAHAQDAPSAPDDPMVEEVVAASLQPCSCDCCTVAERQKFEQQVFADGSVLDKKCVPPAADSADGKCPVTCKASTADRVLTAAVTTMDTSRFCAYKCKPSVQMVGSLCIRLTEKEVAQTVSEDGNGNSDSPVFAPEAQLDEGNELAAPSGPTAGKAAAGPGAKKDEKEDEKLVRYDMRKVIAQRLRAEAAADMGRAAASEQRVHADAYSTEKDKELAQYVQTALSPVAGKGQEAQVATDAEAKTSAEEAALAQTHLREAAVDAQTVVEETKKLVKAEIFKQAKAAAKQEAEADAYMAAWDKPDNWGKTLAVRAAAPYLTEMVNAIQRTSEYEGFSKGLLAEAQGAQNQAQSLILHANQMKAVGDLLGSATEEKKVKLLIGKAKNLEEEANKFWKIADDTRKTIPEWQMGGNMAAARAAWEFKVAFTPPPDAFIQTDRMLGVRR